MATATTLAYTGAVQTYTVPAGVTTLKVILDGAAGGYTGGPGGKGGRVVCFIPVTAGHVLNVYVGGTSGNNAGGYNGGGSAQGSYGYGGGGATVITDSTSSTLLAVAGGGGGAGYNGGGAGGQPNGFNGGAGYSGESGGNGATQTAGGYGANSGTGPATAAAPAAGAGGGGAVYNGGGGGGGYYGGGGGWGHSDGANYGGGGGGGSSWVVASAVAVAYSQAPGNAAGQAILQPDKPPVAPILTAPAASAVTDLNTNGGPFTWTFSDPDAGDTEGAIAFRRKLSGNAYQWWNGTTWQSTEVFITYTTGTLTFPAGQWPSGSYVWSVATQDQLGYSGPYAADRTVIAASPPSAPTLTAPANASYQDTSGGSVAFTAVYNSTDAQNANAYALRVKVSGGAYSYWNAGTNALQGTIVWNPVTVAPGGTISATLTAAAVPNGSTYNYSFAAQEAEANLQGAFASDFTFTAEAGPQLTVTGPTGASVTQTPTVSWTSVLPSGAVQTAYRVVVETGAYGSVPGSGVSQYDSLVVSSAAQSVVTAALTNQTTFRAFVQITETGGLASAWVFTGFTINLDVPSPPIVTGAVFDGTLQRILVSVQGTDNLLSANAASIETDTTAWTAGANTTLARSTAQAADGLASLSLTATAAGAVSASTATGTAGIPVTPGQQVTGLLSARAATAGRTVTVGVAWYTAAGAPISTSPASGPDVTTAFGQISVTDVAPGSAAFAALTVSVAGLGAGEVHYVDAAGIMPGSLTAWSRGGLAGNGTAVLQRSNDGGVTWATVRNAGALALPLPSQSASVYDYDAPPNLTVQYRAMTQDVV